MKSSLRKEIMVLWSVLAIMAVNANETLISGVESDDTILKFVSKFSLAFSTYNFVDLLSFAGTFFLLMYIYKEPRKFNLSGAIVSAIFSFLYIWSFSYKTANDTSILFGNSFQIFLTVMMFIGLFGLFYIIFEFFCVLLEKQGTCNGKKEEFGKKHFFIGVCMIMLGWLPWLIMNYPGSVAGDTIGQLGQFFSGEVNAHHPPLSTFLIGGCVKLGEILIDRNFGVFLYLLLQAVLGSVLFTYSVYKMYELGISKMYCVAAMIFFVFTPLFGLYSQWLQKDMLYSEFVLMYVLLMVDILRENKIDGKKTILLFTVGMLVCLLRNNGIYVIVPTYIFLAIYFRGQQAGRTCQHVHLTVVERAKNSIVWCRVFDLKRKRHIRMIFLAIATVILYLCITIGLYPILGIKNGSVREALSIPMQQTARYLRDHGSEVTEDERNALEGFCHEYEKMPEIYDPTCADPVKDIVNVEIRNPVGYFKAWLKMGLKHPETYFDAFMNMNYGYLAPNEQNVEPDLSVSYDQQLVDMGLRRMQKDTPVQIFSKIVFINVAFPFLRYMTMPGLYTWIVIVSVALLIKYERKEAIGLLVPEIMTILVCLASPLCNGLRYELPVVFVTPLMIAWTWYQVKAP